MQSLALDCIFVSSGYLFDRTGEGAEEIEVSHDGSNIYTYDNKKENPNPGYNFLVRVGGGFQAFKTRAKAKAFYNTAY